MPTATSGPWVNQVKIVLMGNVSAITGADIGLGSSALTDHAVLINEHGKISDVCPVSAISPNQNIIELQGGSLVPGCIDLQVNGGGGVLFNNDISVDAIETICRAHRQLGTCRLLVTLISSTAQNTTAAIAAAIKAVDMNIPGFLGLHLEGPHLSAEKKGAHNELVLRCMTQSDLDELCAASERLPHLMVTIAPEMVTNEQIAIMNRSGIVVSLGHSNADCADAIMAYNHGARCATHLYNAMSPLTSREPGMVGAALSTEDAYAGLITDGVHVDAAAIKIAIKAKTGRGKLFIVSDAMATAGSTLSEFSLDGRKILRKKLRKPLREPNTFSAKTSVHTQSRLELIDGTLAGADTDMLSSVLYLIDDVGVDESEALSMAARNPCSCIDATDYLGSLTPGKFANIVHLDADNQLQQVWVDGVTQL